MIIKKSGVGRATFYRHFYTKDDILITKLNIKTMELVEMLVNNYDITVYDKDIEKYWDEFPEIINIIIYLNKTQLIYSAWLSLLMDLFDTIDMGLSSKTSKLYTAHFAIGGLTSLLIQWFNNNRKESIDFLSKHFYIPN